MLKEVADHQPVVKFTKENMDADKLVPVVNILTVVFIGGPSNQVRTDNIHVAWGSSISVAVVTAVGVPIEEAFSDIGMNARRCAPS